MTEKKRYHGSCHCGAVTFECEVDLTAGTSRCNRSHCRKGRFWKAIVPAPALRVLQGQDSLHEYRFGSHTIRHRFCRHCGMKVFGHNDLEAPGEDAFYAINVACLDDAPMEELFAAPIRHEDGQHDNWAQPPEDGRWERLL